MDKTPWNIYTEDMLSMQLSSSRTIVSTNGLPVPTAPCWSTDFPKLPSIFLYQTWYLDRIQQSYRGWLGSCWSEDFLRLWKLHLPNIQIKNLPIDVSAQCENLNNEMNHDSSEFQKLNINNFGPVPPADGLNEARCKYLR